MFYWVEGTSWDEFGAKVGLAMPQSPRVVNEWCRISLPSCQPRLQRCLWIKAMLRFYDAAEPAISQLWEASFQDPLCAKMSRQFTVPSLFGTTTFRALILHVGKVSHFSSLPRLQALAGRSEELCFPPSSCIWLHLKFQTSTGALSAGSCIFFFVFVSATSS